MEISKQQVIKSYYSMVLLPELIKYAVMEQAARLVNSIYYDSYTELYKLDAIYYHLIELHNDKIMDIFD